MLLSFSMTETIVTLYYSVGYNNMIFIRINVVLSKLSKLSEPLLISDISVRYGYGNLLLFIYMKHPV